LLKWQIYYYCMRLSEGTIPLFFERFWPSDIWQFEICDSKFEIFIVW
jgi:hypothetical protein